MGLVAAACTGNDGGEPAGDEATEGVEEAQQSDAQVEPCGLGRPGSDPVDTGSPATDAIQVSGEVFDCAHGVVVVDGADLNAAAVGAQLAAAVEGPLLLAHDDVDAELDRLGPSDVYLLGDVAVTVPDGAEEHRIDATGAGEAAAEIVGVDAEPALPPEPDATTVAETLDALASGDRVVVPGAPGPASPDSPEPASDTAEIDVREVLAGLDPPTGAQGVWIVEASDPAAAFSMATLGRPAEAAVVPVDGNGLFGHPELDEVLTGREDDSIRAVGTFPERADWQLRTIANGYQLPGGGYELFPDDLDRRFIAFYGHPETGGLGVLGQQDGPESTLERMRPLLEEYEAEGGVAVPTFNPIVTVAHNGGSTDQPEVSEITAPRYVNYSTMHPVSTFQEWADYAAEVDGYFMMDFQPGRNDFLYQVQHYEELVRLPHVGVALDPEWRLGSNQSHLRQIGTVDAAELNDVIEWVADLVRDEGLPQKLIMIHQFQLRMIENRDELVDRDEVALVIQMDGEGQGSFSTKEETWNLITEGTEDAHWHFGWKNFLEPGRDHPDGPMSAEQTMDRDPQPVYVSYQ